MSDRVPYRSKWTILVLDDSMSLSRISQAVQYLDGMFPQFPPEGLSLTINLEPEEGVDYVYGEYEMDIIRFSGVPKPTNIWTGLLVADGHPAVNGGALPTGMYDYQRWSHPSPTLVEDLAFAIFHMLPLAHGLAPFVDMEYMSAGRQYLYDNGNPSPEFADKAWAMIYMYWRVNFRDSLFPGMPIPPLVEPSGISIYPDVGDVGDTVTAISSFTNIGEQDKTLPTYFNFIAHNQALIKQGNIPNIPAGQDHYETVEYVITERAKSYQNTKPVTICSRVTG